MRFNKALTPVYLIAAAVIALVAVQAYWLSSSLAMANEEFDMDLRLRMERMASSMDDDMVCFELFSKRTVAKGDQFFMLVPGEEEGKLDTVKSYYWTAHGEDTLWQEKGMTFNSAPASVEIQLKVNYLHDPTRIGGDSLSDMERSIQKEYAHAIVLKDENLEVKLMDTLRLARVVAEEMEPLADRFSYQYAVVDAKSGEAIVNSASSLESSFVQPLFANQNFIKPLELHVFVPGKSWSIAKGFIPMVAAFLVVIGALLLLLILSYRSVMQQRKLSQMKVDLVNNMTHEFNTPIANISLALDTLRNQQRLGGTLEPERILQIIGSENTRLKENIDKVMKVSLMDGGGLDLAWAEVDVHDIIMELEDRFELVLKAGNGRIKPILKASGTQVLGDRTHLRNVIYNLVDNALKYSQGKADVEIETTNANGALQVEVRDKGIGIANNDLKHIFEKFFRVHSGSRHDVKGFGLGLHYVKTIVDAHRGHIEVNSAVGEGTIFRIQLPINEHG